MADTTNNAGATVLIVDDEEFIRKSVSEILGDEGYRVETAENSEQCMQALKNKKIDVILMDIQMPGLSGLETFKRIAKEDYKVDTIMISGHGTIETAVEAVKYGAADFLEKPFSLARLKKTVRTVVERRLQSGKLEKTIGNYIIESEIAGGATAMVYRAVHKNLNRTVALKILHPHLIDESTFALRFEREAQTTAALSHPNIIQIFDYGRHGNAYYLAMEYVDGSSLKDFVQKDQRLPLPICACIGIKVGRALGHAHANSIIHRDIKPTNILISRKGEVKLVDFGISRCLDKSALSLTQPEQIVGTPLFMSPEQINGWKVGPASDIFSFGTLLYLITTLYYPFSGANLGAVVRSITACKYREPAAVNPDIDRELNRIIVTCLREDPAKRYASSSALCADLERYAVSKETANIDKALKEYFSALG